MMDIPLIAARAVHYVGAISLCGLFGFAGFVAPRPRPELRRALAWLGWISLALVLVSGPFRLLFVAQNMVGASLADTVAHGIPRLVLTSTQYGHVALLRFALLVALLPFVARLGRRRALDIAAAVIAAVEIALLAWQGHAGADTGWDGAIHLAADAGHLVAAGLWLGALLPLALFLRGTADVAAKYAAARRFSVLGVLCVAVLLVSGVVNTWYLVGSVPALLGTLYGQTLLVKLALVAVLLGLAAVNRWRLVPRLAAGDDGEAGRRLARHAMIETMLGSAVIVIVAALGTMVPAAFQHPVWPFRYRLDFDALSAPALRLQVGITATLALLGLAIAIFGIWWRRGWAIIVGLALLLGLGWRPIQLLAVATTPMSYAISPGPFRPTNLADSEAGGDKAQLAIELSILPRGVSRLGIALQSDGDLFRSLPADRRIHEG